MDIDIDHIVLGYNFIPMGKDVDKMLDITKQLAKPNLLGRDNLLRLFSFDSKVYLLTIQFS
jgi:hypothetical protein